MKTSQFLLLAAAAAATPALAGVIGLRDTAVESLIQYDGYLPTVPEGWPNITLNTNTTSKALALRERGDVSTRDDASKFAKYLVLATKITVAGGLVTTWMGLANTCKQFTEDTTSAVECVVCAMAQVVAAAGLVYRGYVWRANLATKLNENGWSVPGITKRDELIGEMTRDLSATLKLDVRHLGTWDGATNNQKRDDSEPAVPREVFGIRHDGLDLHFTYLGQKEDGTGMFKFGLGNATVPNEEDIQEKRDMGNSNYYFSQGGIDFESSSIEASDDLAWSWLSITDSTELEAVYTAVKCYIRPFMVVPSNGVHFQIYDSYADATLTVGMMSPFTSTRESNIRNMTLESGIGYNSCGTL